MADEECTIVTKEYMDQVFVALRDKLDGLSDKIDAIGTAAVAKVSSRRGGKRKPSKYNLFIKVCMKGTGKPMKDCAAEYKAAKANGTLDSMIANVSGLEEGEE
jgi:ubiquitin C-terminal hydrolase